jgi:triosephosphate isomerase
VNSFSSKKFVAINLKSYMDRTQTEKWVEEIAQILKISNIDLALLPSFLSIPFASARLAKTGIAVGAQNLSEHGDGAFTGETTASELIQHGCRYVIVGHHERRTLFGESNSTVSAKLFQAISHGLTPILCVGERNQADHAEAKKEISLELRSAFTSSKGFLSAPIVVAYEPTWAIGAAVPATSKHINEMARYIRDELERIDVKNYRLIYGGSAGTGLYSQIATTCDGIFLGRKAHDPAKVPAILDEIYQH